LANRGGQVSGAEGHGHAFTAERRNHAGGIAIIQTPVEVDAFKAKLIRSGSRRSTARSPSLQAAGQEMICGGVPPAGTAPLGSIWPVLRCLHQAGWPIQQTFDQGLIQSL